MDSLFKNFGKRYNRNMSGLEVAKLIGTSRTILYKFLREQNIFCKTNGRNLPTDIYMRKKWFFIKETNVDNENFKGIVTTTMFTPLGYESIRDIIYKDHDNIIHTLNNDSFWVVLANKIRSKLSYLGRDFKTDNELEEHMKKHSYLFTHGETNNKSVFYFANDRKYELIKFNVDNLRIFETC